MSAVARAAPGRGRLAFLVPPLLRDTVFRRFWAASAVSMSGDQVSGIAVPLTAVIALHAGAAAMGYLTALQWLPSLLLGVHAGAWADRHGRRREAMIACDLGRFLLLATIPVCWALHVLTLWQLYAVIFAAGALSIVFGVAYSTLFVSIVDEPLYVDGQSLLYGSRAMSFVAGPSAGGLLAQLLTAPFAIIADALSFLGSAFFLARIRPDEPPASGRSAGVTEGLRFIARSPIVRSSLTGIATVNLFNLMFTTLYTLYAVRTLHISPGLLGVILGCGALGGVLGSALTKRIAARLGVGMAYVASAFCFTAPVALVPLAPVPHGHAPAGPVVLVMVFAAEFLLGFGVMVLDISIGSIFAAVIPGTVRSRVGGAFQAINYGTRPAGALLGGALGAAIGLRPALWIAVTGGVLGAALLMPSPLPRFRLPSLAPGFVIVGVKFDGVVEVGQRLVVAAGFVVGQATEGDEVTEGVRGLLAGLLWTTRVRSGSASS